MPKIKGPWELPKVEGGTILVSTISPTNAPACVLLVVGDREFVLDAVEAADLGEKLIEFARSLTDN